MAHHQGLDARSKFEKDEPFITGGVQPKEAEEEEDEDKLIRRLNSRTLARHLYDRHSNDFFAYLNLTLSTVTMGLLGRSVHAPSGLNWLLGWTASELGQVYIVLQVLNLYRVFRYHPRVFQGWFGRLALLVNSWSMVGIGSSVLKSFNARAEFSEALMAQKIQPIAGTSSNKYSYLLSLIPLFVVSRRGKHLQYRKNIRYADMEKVDPQLLNTWKRTPLKLRNLSHLLFRGRISSWLSLDVIYTEGLRNAPVFLYFHGGGWSVGSKDIGPHAFAERMASRGIIICMVNYRLSPEVVWPAHIEDCKRAIIYIKKHIAEFGGDPDKVFVGGESAGGHLSALIGATPNLSAFQPKEDPYADTSVVGVVPICGVFDFCDEFGHHKAISSKLLDVRVGIRTLTSRIVMQQRFSPETKQSFELASPVYYIRQLLNAEQNPKIPPYFIPHGTEDLLAAYEDAEEFYNALQNLRKRWGTWAEGETDVFATIDGGLHAFGYFPSNRAHSMGDAVTDFIFHHAKRIDVAKHQPVQQPIQ